MKIINRIILSLLAFAAFACSDDPAPGITDRPNPVESKIIAHHGIWDVPGSAANSLTAFQLAFEDSWCAGTQVDITQTADGSFAVYHDSKIDGKPIIDMTLEQVQSHKLANGERIPSLTEVLELHKKYPRKVLLLDLKTVEIDCLLKAVEDYPLKEQLMYTTFSGDKCRSLNKGGVTTAYIRTYNVSNVEVDFCLEWHIAGVSINSNSLDENPESVEYFHSLGMKYIVFYPSKYDDIIKYINMGVDYVITDWVPYHK